MASHARGRVLIAMIGGVHIAAESPYLLVGWLWYLIMLLPVIGIVEVGLQGHADRYTYLPHVGLYIALTWLVSDVPDRYRTGKKSSRLLAAALSSS